MNDEMRQFRSETFNRIILAVVSIGLVTALAAVIIDGVTSPWFIRAIALLLVAIVAQVIRKFGRFVVASYVLVLQLLGLIVEMLLRPDAMSSFVPYLLIPMAIVSGLLLNPVVTFVVTVCSVVAVLLVAMLVSKLSVTSFVGLLLPLGLTLFAALLVAESKRFSNMLAGLLAENSKLLKERTLEVLDARKQSEGLQRQITAMKLQQGQPGSEFAAVNQANQQTDKRLYELIKGAIQEISGSVEKLEQFVEQVAERINNTPLITTAWQKIDHLKALAVNLSEIANIEHGQIKLDYSEVDINRLLGEIASTARGLARGKDLEIRYQPSDNLPSIQADVGRVRQVLLHLLQNAIKYTDQGVIELQAEVNKNDLIIFVSDTGIGMHREEAELVFENFGRGSGTLAQQRQGTGLGLAINKRIIEMHGGRMWVTSVLGIGSTFYLTLPLQVTREKSRAAATLIDRGLVTAPLGVAQSAPEPVAAIETRDATNNGISMAAATATAPSADPDATIVSPRLTPEKAKHPSQPIHRYGPTYIRRFGFILLGLLFIVIAIVGILAALNLSGPQATIAAATPTVMATTSASQTQPESNTPVLAGEEEATPIALDSPTPLPTNTPLPTEPSTATAVSENLPASTPAVVVPTSTFTPLPPTATELPEATKQPTLAVPTPTIAATESPSATLPQVSFVTAQGRVNSFNLDENVEFQADNNRLSLSPTGQLLFTGEENGERDIYVANTASTLPVNLTTLPGDDLQPVWSPDGNRIAFSSGRGGNFDIYVMNADGSNLARLTDSRGFDEWPAWSPDGSKLAFVTDRDGNVEIYAMNDDGSNQKRLTNHPADDWPAAWSPDGDWLVFASNRDGDWNLYLMSVTGGPAFRLTDALGNERDPVWSPDGKSIAFAYDGGGNWDIYSLTLPASSITEVPQTEWTQITNTPQDERYPIWPQ